MNCTKTELDALRQPPDEEHSKAQSVWHCLNLDFGLFFSLQKGGTKTSFQFDSDELVDSDSWGPMILKEKRRKNIKTETRSLRKANFKLQGLVRLQEEILNFEKKGGSGEFWIP